MKIVAYDDFRAGVLVGEGVADVTSLLPDAPPGWEPWRMCHLIEHWDDLRPRAQELAEKGPTVPLADVRLLPPVPKPAKIVAAPINYMAHGLEMSTASTVDNLGVFLKAPSAIIGPGGTIRLPYTDRRVDHEAELAMVVGRTAKDVSAADALDYVLGYLCLLDITVRGSEERVMRKSFDTFAPIGPAVVTTDEVGEPDNLSIRLWVNDELRQDGNTKDLIYDCRRLVEFASSVMTLYPGDILSTGTPEGVGPIHPGDRVTIDIERVGRMSVGVTG